MQEFKIRCSAISQIMGAAKGSITEKQLQTIKEYEAKTKLTDKQLITLTELKEKANKPPELPETAKSYCKRWFLENKYGRRYEFSSKYTEKGTQQEGEGIELLKRIGVLSEFSDKNTTRYENEFLTGEMDVIEPEFILDVKCSYELFTFPYFDTDIKNKAYIDQLQGYMELANKDSAKLAYCLVDTPEDIIEKELYYKINSQELTKQEIEGIYKNHRYSDIPDIEKAKIFNIDRDREFMREVKERVFMCRKYISTLR